MATQIISSGGDLTRGGTPLTASDGTKLSVLVTGSNTLALYSDVDGTPNLEDSDIALTIHGDSASIGYADAAIDSNDNIHLLSMVGANASATMDVSYAIATYSAGSWTFGSWEEAGPYTSAVPNTRFCKISLDSNDKPHIVYMNGVTSKGSTQDQIMYTEKTGANWATPTQLSARADKTDGYRDPFITIKASNNIEVVYNHYTGGTSTTLGDLVYRTYTGSWSGESSYAETTIRPYGVTATTGGTVYRYHGVSGGNIEENNVSTGFLPVTLAGAEAGMALDGTDRYIIYIASDADVHYYYNTGGGWTDGGDLQVGTMDYVQVDWCYNNNNQSGEIGYIYEVAGAIYYDVLSLAAGTLYYQSAAGALTSAGVIVKQAGKPVAGALTSAGAVVKSTATSLAGTLTSAGTVVKETLKSYAGILTSSGVLATNFTKMQALAGTLTSAGVLVKETGKGFAGTLTSAGELVKETAVSYAGVLTSAGTVVKETAKSFTGALTSSGVLGTSFTKLLSLAGTLTSSGDVVKQAAKGLTGALTSAGDVIKQTAKGLTGTLTSSGVLDAVKQAPGIFYQAVAGVLTSSGDLVKETSKGLAGTLTSAGNVVKRTAKSFAGTLTSSGILDTGLTKLLSLAGTLTSSGILTKRAGKGLAGALTSAGTVVKQTAKGLAGTLASAGTLVKQTAKSLAGALASSGVLAPVLNPVTQVIALTLKVRNFSLSLLARAFGLELKSRDLDLTLPDRDIEQGD